MEVFMGTPHNEASNGDIAKIVLMPGDPLRAKFIAETYLEDVVQFNTVRNMFGYTGMYRGKRISVMGSGMGMPSMGIYSYELYTMYGVESIIRIGSAGALLDDLNCMDVVLAMSASTNSNYASQYKLPGVIAPTADFDLLKTAFDEAGKLGVRVKAGNVLSSDTFYSDDTSANDAWHKMGVMCVEMESAALYLNAQRLGKKALCILTISDHIYKKEELDAKQRQIGFTNMMEIALNTAINFAD
jgi:purine-nucleoside phosphorylase